jgi:predicted Zn finger-like uncharacterized protein
MLVNCKSCLKKFEVPDSAITEAGRLLQCGSCGNKWTQFPIVEKQQKKIQKIAPPKKKDPSTTKIKKTFFKKKKREINLYSEEYLKKKHNLTINHNFKNVKNESKKTKSNFSFYSYIILISVFIISLIGILNLTQEIIISKYPFTEFYVSYLNEVFNIIKITVLNFIY